MMSSSMSMISSWVGSYEMPLWSLINTRFCYPVSESIWNFFRQPTRKSKWSIESSWCKLRDVPEEFPNERDTICRTIGRFDYSIIHSMLDRMMCRMRNACEYICDRLSSISDRSPGSFKGCLDPMLTIVLRKDDSSEIFEGCTCCIEDIRDISCSGFCHSFYGDFFCDSINGCQGISLSIWWSWCEIGLWTRKKSLNRWTESMGWVGWRVGGHKKKFIN